MMLTRDDRKIPFRLIIKMMCTPERMYIQLMFAGEEMPLLGFSLGFSFSFDVHTKSQPYWVIVSLLDSKEDELKSLKECVCIELIMSQSLCSLTDILDSGILNSFVLSLKFYVSLLSQVASGRISHSKVQFHYARSEFDVRFVMDAFEKRDSQQL